MAKEKLGTGEILSTFFDDGVYTPLLASGAVEAAHGCAGGQPVYAVCQNGGALTVKDVEKQIKVLEMAALTGNPVVTFYDSVGAKLEEGLDVLTAASRLNAAIAKVSGVVPQVAVVVGVCGASAALAAASADVCIMAEGAELFFTAPFTSAAHGDKPAGAGSAEFAAKAGVAALTAKTAAEAVALAARIVTLLPGNNLAGPSVFEFEAPAELPDLVKYDAAQIVKSLVDEGSAIELFSAFGGNVYTALATVGGNAVGVVATQPAELCRACVDKAARLVRLCDAFSIPVVTVVNSEGFVPSASEDQAGGLRAAARLAGTYADATTARVALLMGKAVGPVYTALANADLRLAVTGCTVSALEPLAATRVLFKDKLEQTDNLSAATSATAVQYAAQHCSAAAAVAAGAADLQVDAAGARAALVNALDILASKRAQRLPKKHGNMAL